MNHLPTVLQLTVYPVKSLGGCHVTEWKAGTEGFDLDRKWMLIDAENRFITQRTMPQLTQFLPSMAEDSIIIQYRDSTVTFSVQERSGHEMKVGVWDDIATTREVSTDVSRWFSDHLERQVRLVRLAHPSARLHHSSRLQKNLPVSLADAYPYLITGTASLNTLNSLLKKSIPFNRFRPNIVLSTQTAHEEDEWGVFGLGEARFQSVKPCGRCTVITIDQETASIDKEPLTVLNTYRKRNQSVEFGAHTICLAEGWVRVGDTVQWIE